MRHYIVHNQYGVIVRCGTVQDIAFDDIVVGIGEQKMEAQIKPDDMQTRYVYGGQIVSRPLMDTHPTIISKTDNVAESEVITITGVPAGADIWVEGEKYNLAAGETVLELTFDTVGKYGIRIVSHPYQDWERTVTVI